MHLRFLPIYGVILFIALYFYAGLLYPGGSYLDPNSVGFSWKLNYWCDLLDLRSHSGKINPARPIAITSMIVLAGALSYFWILVAQIFAGKYSRWVIGVFGPLAMLAATLLFTSLHNFLIYFSVPLGFVAFLTTLYEIRHERLAFYLSLIPVGFGLANFIFWHFSYSAEWLPLIQKLAFAGFFTWVCYLTKKMATLSNSSNLQAAAPECASIE